MYVVMRGMKRVILYSKTVAVNEYTICERQKYIIKYDEKCIGL